MTADTSADTMPRKTDPPADKKRPTSFRLSPAVVASLKEVQTHLHLRSEAAALDVFLHQYRREMERYDAAPPLDADEMAAVRLVVEENGPTLGSLATTSSLAPALGVLVQANAARAGERAGLDADGAFALAAKVAALPPFAALWAVRAAAAD